MSVRSAWDSTLFLGAAEFYELGRLPYAENLAGAFRSALGADGSGRLLDVGSGPGSIAFRLAGVFREVVGLDPDPGMIAEADRLAYERGVGNARFVQAVAEDLPYGLGEFDVVTFGASFHWMDRERVAEAVRTMLRPGGVAVQIDSGPLTNGLAGPFPAPPRELIRDLVQHYLGPERRAGQTTGFVSPSDEREVWRAAGYVAVADVRVPDRRILTRTIDEVIAGTLSMSSSAPHLFEDRLPHFRADLRTLLEAESPSGRFSVALGDNTLHVWRPA